MPFVAGNKKNIIVGAAALFIGDSFDGTGTDSAPEPVDGTSYRETVSDAAGWRNVGYTTEGLEVSNDPSYTDIAVDQLLDAAKIFKDSMGMSVNTTLAEATLENLLVAWGQSADTLSSTATEKTLDLAGGSLGEAPVERGLIAVGNAPEKAGSNEYGERTYKVHRVLSVESSSHSLARADATNLPVSFRCLPASSGSYGFVRDRYDV